MLWPCSKNLAGMTHGQGMLMLAKKRNIFIYNKTNCAHLTRAYTLKKQTQFETRGVINFNVTRFNENILSSLCWCAVKSNDEL